MESALHQRAGGSDLAVARRIGGGSGVGLVREQKARWLKLIVNRIDGSDLLE